MGQTHMVRAAVAAVRRLLVLTATVRLDWVATAAQGHQIQSAARQLLMQAAVAVDANLPARPEPAALAEVATADKVRHKMELQTLAAALAEVVTHRVALAEAEL